MSASPYEYFFRYTGGRWLWDEDNRLRERFVVFNVHELHRIAAESVGAKSCISMAKLPEGGYNKVFRLVMENGSVAIARIPNPNAGPACKTTASEVATMEFTRTILGIPTPKVYAWNASADNPVEAEYIIMEEAPGTQLGEVWDSLHIDDKTSIIKDIVNIEQKLLSVSFTRYGNIYYAKDMFPGCEAAEITGDFSEEIKEEVRKRFVIGPVVDRSFWDGERATMDINRGPWTNPQEYLTSVGTREISWINHFAIPKSAKDASFVSESQNSPNAHVSLYKSFLDVVPYIPPADERFSRSTLWHWDLHSANVFVKGNRISSLIDWQKTWAGPLFLQYRRPKLVDYTGELVLDLPDDYEILEANEQHRIGEQLESSMVLCTYEMETEKINPLLSELLHLPYGQTRKETVHFATNTWDGDILPFRQCLIRIERHWSEFGFGDPCPIQFTEDEIQTHYRDGEGWNEWADFWDSVSGLINRDGWTSNETFGQAVELFTSLREQGLRGFSLKESGAFEIEARRGTKQDAPIARDTDVQADLDIGSAACIFALIMFP